MCVMGGYIDICANRQLQKVLQSNPIGLGQFGPQGQDSLGKTALETIALSHANAISKHGFDLLSFFNAIRCFLISRPFLS